MAVHLQAVNTTFMLLTKQLKRMQVSLSNHPVSYSNDLFTETDVTFSPRTQNYLLYSFLCVCQCVCVQNPIFKKKMMAKK